MNKLLLVDDDDILVLLETLVVYTQLNLSPGDVDYDIAQSLIHRLHRLLE